MKKRGRDIETWKDVVEELERLLETEDGRSHGRLVRSWLIDQKEELEGAAGGDL